MRAFKTTYAFMLTAAALSVVAGATEVRADACSASLGSIISRSAGGTCPTALSLNEEFTITYELENNSEIDDGTSPNDGDAVDAEIRDGEVMTLTLAQETSGQGGTQIPGTLTFIPVCPADSVGGSLNPGDECDPNLAQCGSAPCGCAERLPGVTCEASGANIVLLEATQDIPFGPDEEREVATIRVRLDDVVDTSTCGQFFTRFDGEDILTVIDTDCDAELLAGAQASADLHAPECAADADCGDTECNECVDIETDPHCEVANEGDPCGTDGDPDDCQTPACVDDDGEGVCQQNVNDEPQGTPCDDGEDVDCTDDECDADGECIHTPDDDNCDDEDACTTDVCDPELDCVREFICEAEGICRSPGYWATHSGTEHEKSINVGQLVLDTVGGIEVCGQTITETEDALDSLDSNLEGLCVRVRGISERQLYRQLVAAGLNCAVSGADGQCDTLMDALIEVSYEECNEVCAGTPDADPPSIGDCIANLDCFNNGGIMIEGECTFGTCSEDGEVCAEDSDCDQEEDPQTCDPYEGNCHDAVLCNEELDICPKNSPAGSKGACREARNGNDCTIDDCD